MTLANGDRAGRQPESARAKDGRERKGGQGEAKSRSGAVAKGRKEAVEWQGGGVAEAVAQGGGYQGEAQTTRRKNENAKPQATTWRSPSA